MKKSLVHAIAECKCCTWRWEDYLTAQEEALRHARKMRHRVIIELGYVAEYDGETNEDKP